MKKVLLSGFILLMYLSGFSQDLKIIKVPQAMHTESSVVIDGVTTHNYSTGKTIPVNGTPFLNEKFSPGILELHDGKKSEEVMLRYNIAQDLFEIFRGKDTLTINRPYDLKAVYFMDKTFIYNPKLRTDAERKQNGFFEVLVNGDFTLYKKRNKDMSFDSFAGNYQGGAGTKEYYYVDKIAFVGKTPKGNVFLMNSSKSFLKNLNDHKPEMKAFIKAQKIKFKKEADLIKLVDYYNQL
jgi:hypothetical protein